MADLVMLIYIALSLGLAVAVHALCSPKAVFGATQLEHGAIGGVVLFAFMATPPVATWVYASHLWTVLSHQARPDWLEHLAALISSVCAAFIVLRAFAIWLLLLALAAIGYGALALLQWIF